MGYGQDRKQPATWQIVLVLGVGIGAASTAAILVRLAIAAVGTTGVGFSLVLAASRLGLAAIVLLPTWRGLATHPPTGTAWRWAIGAGVALALHFATWITSLSYTSIAASTALVTTNPVWVALFSWLWLHEIPTPLGLLGITVALVGGVTIGLAGSSLSSGAITPNPLLGNGLALVGAVAASTYFLLGRQAQRHGLPIQHYATIAYTTAAIVLLPLPGLLGAGYTGYPPIVYGYMLLMALVPQLVGHTSLNWAVGWVSPTLVTLGILFEPVLSSGLGYLFFAEVPGGQVLVGAAVLLVGIAIAVVSR